MITFKRPLDITFKSLLDQKGIPGGEAVTEKIQESRCPVGKVERLNAHPEMSSVNGGDYFLSESMLAEHNRHAQLTDEPKFS